jgi:hypothetical protein
MSSFRPNYKSGGWRAKEAKAAEEVARKKTELTEANFPTLVDTARPLTAVGGNHFAELAEKWNMDEEVNKKMEAYRRDKAARAARETEHIMAFHHRRTYGEDYYEAPVESPTYSAPASTAPRNQPDSDGWVEVSRKVRKPKRELTIAEMEARDANLDDDSETNPDDFNGNLFESNRHDHDRV